MTIQGLPHVHSLWNVCAACQICNLLTCKVSILVVTDWDRRHSRNWGNQIYFPSFVYIVLVLYLFTFQMRHGESASLYIYFKRNYHCSATMWVHDLCEPDKSSMFYTCTRSSVLVSCCYDTVLTFPFYWMETLFCFFLKMTDPCCAAGVSFKWSTVLQCMTGKNVTYTEGSVADWLLRSHTWDGLYFLFVIINIFDMLLWCCVTSFINLSLYNRRSMGLSQTPPNRREEFAALMWGRVWANSNKPTMIKVFLSLKLSWQWFNKLQISQKLSKIIRNICVVYDEGRWQFCMNFSVARAAWHIPVPWSVRRARLNALLH